MPKNNEQPTSTPGQRSSITASYIRDHVTDFTNGLTDFANALTGRRSRSATSRASSISSQRTSNSSTHSHSQDEKQQDALDILSRSDSSDNGIDIKELALGTILLEHKSLQEDIATLKYIMPDLTLKYYFNLRGQNREEDMAILRAKGYPDNELQEYFYKKEVENQKQDLQAFSDLIERLKDIGYDDQQAPRLAFQRRPRLDHSGVDNTMQNNLNAIQARGGQLKQIKENTDRMTGAAQTFRQNATQIKENQKKSPFGFLFSQRK